MKHITFNNQEIDWLKINYSKLGNRECSKYLNVPIKAISIKAAWLGLLGKPSREISITQSQENKILEQFHQKNKQKIIAANLGISTYLVQRTLKRHGIEIKAGNRSELLAPDIIRDYMDNVLTWDEISKKFAISKTQIARIIKKNGCINLNRKNLFRGDVNTRRQGKTTYQLWIDRYGEEEANKRQDSLHIKQSKNSSGKNNNMYGKPAPQGAGNGWKGRYKDHYFRSLRELMFMIDMDTKGVTWISGEKGNSIRYQFNGSERTYRPDFIAGNIMYELKPIKLHNTPNVLAKKEAAEAYCLAKGMEYKLTDWIIDAIIIKTALDKGDVCFDRKYLEKFYSFVRMN